MLKLHPPQNAIDDPIEWIAPNDPAWDMERVKREQKALGDAAVEALVSEAVEAALGVKNASSWDEVNVKAVEAAEAVVIAAFDGAVSESDIIDARQEVAARMVSDADKDAARLEADKLHPVDIWYLGGSKYSHDAPLTVPELLRTEEYPAPAVTISEYLTGTPTTFVIKSLGLRGYRKAFEETDYHTAFVRRGLVRIEGVESSDGEAQTLKPAREKDGQIAWAWMDGLDRQGRNLIRVLGSAVINVCQGESERGKL